MTKHLLTGIQPEPLAPYLAGLGIIRLLGEQADGTAEAWWDTTGLVVETTVDDLASWLAEQYVPTPVLRAWNKDDGFGLGEGPPSPALAKLLDIPSPRLDLYRATLVVANEAAARFRGAWSKEHVVREFRNRCPEQAVAWIDAAAVLAGIKVEHPPLLGTGGSDGNFDFADNLHQHLTTIFAPGEAAAIRRLALIRDVLHGTQIEGLARATVGQFDPGAAGGRNSSPFGRAKSLVNPWTFVLMIEGTMLFAATLARRSIYNIAGRAAIPFTVTQSAEGSASGANEASRGELWAPLWGRPLTYSEIRHIFGEARAAWRGRPAQQAVEFYAATRTLGVSLGIEAFLRYGIHQRNGDAHVAVPIERVVVENKPAVALAERIEGWVKSARRGETSTAIGQAVRRYDKACMEFAKTGEPLALGQLLVAVTDLELAIGRSGRAREAIRVRVPPNAQRFLDVLRQAESPELRLAVGFASCRTQRGTGLPRSMRQILLPVDSGRPRPEWRATPIVAGFDLRPLDRVLADVLAWRARTAIDEQSDSDDARQIRGFRTFRLGVPVPAADLHAWAQERLDEKLLTMWLKACLALDWRGVRHVWPGTDGPGQPLPLLAMLQALASGVASGGGEEIRTDGSLLALQPDWPNRLIAGRIRDVHVEATQRLGLAGITGPEPPSDTILEQIDGARIAAALVARCAHPHRMLHAYLSIGDETTEPIEPGEEIEDIDSETEEELS